MLFPWLCFLKDDEQLLVETFTKRWVVNGPRPYLAPPFSTVKRRKALTLGPTDYVRIRNTLAGELHNELGPKQVFLGAHEAVVASLEAIPLRKDQFIQLVDKQTGAIRVERGETSVYLSPTEEVLDDGVNTATSIDEHIAVLVRDRSSGQLDLITEPQVFIPSPNQQVVEVRNRVLLEEHETVVVRDSEGRYAFRRGTDQESSFFLEPYSKLVKFYWSTGIHKDERSLVIVRIDSRPKFMWYEFAVRTKDNVELIIGVTFFWQIVDVEKMVGTTDDAPGDVCSHARSAIIQYVSQITLEAFLDSFNAIVREAVLEADDDFYAERGVTLHAVEVRSITCKEAETQRILQEIIQETTNRLNRLQKQESENEVALARVRGELESERLKGELLDLQRDHAHTMGRTQGEAEAERVRAFVEGVSDTLSTEDRIAIFNTLRKQDMLAKLSEGTAQLFFTPTDVDLSIETQ